MRAAGDRAEAARLRHLHPAHFGHSLSFDHVIDKEISIIREQANGEAVYFYPLALTPTPKFALDLVRDKNLPPAYRQAVLRLLAERAQTAYVEGGRRDRGDCGTCNGNARCCSG
jgi:hypothetical protein